MKINPAEQAFEEMLPYFATIDAQIGADDGRCQILGGHLGIVGRSHAAV